MDLYDELTKYCSSDVYPFHMPGHKRRLGSMQDPFSFDITEIDGFDDLHHAEGIILDAEKRAAALWNSSETHFLVNGSTCGILSAVLACARDGSSLVMARNCHISAYNAAALSRQKTYYLMPLPGTDLNGRIDPRSLEDALENAGNVSAVLITSPTYDGVVSDIAALARIAHSRGVPLIVDEAHGAHFGMHPVFPPSSVALGADLVIHSLHKTLPSLTQTALIHVNGSLVDRHKLRRMLDIFQTSSPSYVLMASMDRCVRMLSEKGPLLFSRYTDLLTSFRTRMPVPGIRLLETDDPSRILLQPENISSKDLYDILRLRFGLQPEMCCPSYVLMLSSVADTQEGFNRLMNALCLIGQEEAGEKSAGPDREFPDLRFYESTRPSCPDVKMSLHDALSAPRARTPFESARGRICAEYIYMYPPGSPIAAPGELLTGDLVSRIRALKKAGYPLKGFEDHTLDNVYTVATDEGN